LEASRLPSRPEWQNIGITRWVYETSGLDANVLLVTLFSLIISYTISNIHLIIEKITSNGDSLNYEGLLHLKESLEKIVQFKTDRFETESGNFFTSSSDLIFMLIPLSLGFLPATQTPSSAI
jgi:hypothetical protein